MEIKYNPQRNRVQPTEIRVTLPERAPEKKILANLSDEDLAEKSPEELEAIRRAKENLAAIKRTDREVDEMVQQEQFEERVSAYMQSKGLSREQAELLARQEFGLVGPSQMPPVFMQQPEDPITKAVKEVLAERVKEIFAAATAPRGGTDTGRRENATDMAQAIKAAKEQGVSGIYMPDGTLIQLKSADTFGDELVQQATDWIKGKMPDLLTPGTKTGEGLLSSQNPEIVKLGFEFMAKEEERKAAETVAKSRNETLQNMFLLALAAGGGEGVRERLQKLFEGIRGAREAPQQTDSEKTILAPCPKCPAETPVVPGQKVFTCQGCGTENEIDWKA